MEGIAVLGLLPGAAESLHTETCLWDRENSTPTDQTESSEKGIGVRISEKER